MRANILGRTGLTVSRAVLGTMTFGNQVDQSQAAAMVDYALDQGVNFIDTANVYNGGESERMLGNILKGRRKQVVLATKVGLKMGDAPEESGLSPRAIKKQIDESLRRLQTDYVDLYYLHQPDPHVAVGESLIAMHELVQCGKVRHIGASNYAAWQVVEMLWIAERNRLTPPTVAQPMYNLLARGIEQEFLPMCRGTGTAVVAYNPLAGGLLTGKHAARSPVPGSRFDTSTVYRERYWHAANFQALEQLQALADRWGRSVVGLALGWLWDQPLIDGIILGASSLAQLQDNLNVLGEGNLSDEARGECDRIWNTLRGVAPKYNR